MISFPLSISFLHSFESPDPASGTIMSFESSSHIESTNSDNPCILPL